MRPSATPSPRPPDAGLDADLDLDAGLDDMGRSGTAVPVDRPGVSGAAPDRDRASSVILAGFRPRPARGPDRRSCCRGRGPGGADHEIDIEVVVGSASDVSNRLAV
jgi:hypothetical protein